MFTVLLVVATILAILSAIFITDFVKALAAFLKTTSL